MKKIFIAGFFLLMTGSAFAAESGGAFVLEPLRYGDQYTDPCPQAPGAPVPANGYCGEGMQCPGGYEPQVKYCFGGGLHECGITCKTIYNGH